MEVVLVRVSIQSRLDRLSERVDRTLPRNQECVEVVVGLFRIGVHSNFTTKVSNETYPSTELLIDVSVVALVTISIQDELSLLEAGLVSLQQLDLTSSLIQFSNLDIRLGIRIVRVQILVSKYTTSVVNSTLSHDRLQIALNPLVSILLDIITYRLSFESRIEVIIIVGPNILAVHQIPITISIERSTGLRSNPTSLLLHLTALQQLSLEISRQLLEVLNNRLNSHRSDYSTRLYIRTCSNSLRNSRATIRCSGVGVEFELLGLRSEVVLVLLTTNIPLVTNNRVQDSTVEGRDTEVVSRSLDIPSQSRPVHSTFSRNANVVSTSVPVIPVVSILSLISNLVVATSDLHSHLHPQIWIRSTIVVHLTHTSFVLSNITEPASYSYRILIILQVVSDVLNFLRRQIPVEYVVGCTLTIRLVVNNTKTLVGLESSNLILLVCRSTTILHSLQSFSRNVLTELITEVVELQLVLSVTVSCIHHTTCIRRNILTVITIDCTTSLTISPIVIIESKHLLVVQRGLQNDVREL